MVNRIANFLFILILLVGCSNISPLDQNAIVKYKSEKDYASLELIHKKLSKGMQKDEVEALLGEPDYSPINGQYYYSSSEKEYSEQQHRNVPIGLVVDYRDARCNVSTKSSHAHSYKRYKTPRFFP